MKYKLIFVILCMAMGFFARAKPPLQNFDRGAFYAVMASGKMEEINNELLIVRAADFNDREAYEGALLMRKAGLLKKPEEKLKAFKSGRIKLETALLDNNDNGEYRFLRLTIQEHAPKIVKYYKEQDKDSEYIKEVFKNLFPVVQKAILEYSKTSKLLHAEDF